MKNLIKFLIFFSAFFLLTSCKEPSKPTQKTISKKEIVQQIDGTWQDKENPGKSYTITRTEDTIHFASLALKIDTIEKNTIYTHNEQDKEILYTFTIEEKSLTISPSYKVKDSSTELISGGDLPPIKLIRNE